MHGYIIKNEVVLIVFMGTALIDLYGKSRLLETAIKSFGQMVVKEGCTSSAIIFSLGCNSRENQAFEMFEGMKSNGLRPNEITFVGVLTAWARAKLIESVWGALLGACKIHGAVVLGNEVGTRVLELQHLHCGQHVALSHINAGAEKWVHAADLRQAMLKSGIKNIPAYSSINSL
ncbi:hypothetical protein HS088_TW10G00421 [Tripterygium wilfordii]|uniref:Pentatricopeptide repeat-containing protein n=1 Tax=Tripterygium wilfordii TaxID=458696 RepID=A0A7J7D506_TRIWF|nr:hypothetical protein HS088_TW10G00421 [Tripterygium wilfordii]